MTGFDQVESSSRAGKLALRGRDRECAVLRGLVEGGCAGHSAVLVLLGEAGVGKTALLRYAIGSASELRVVRAVGVECEMELAFAALHQLCRPMLDRLEHLPGPQRDALGIAFGIAAGPPPDRFLVGLAVLSLLSELFLSSRTVEWHLRKVFTKLGITSRRELHTALPEIGRLATSA